MIPEKCVVVETHFVGDYAQAPVKLKGLTVAELRQLIERLLREHEPVTSEQLRAYFWEDAALPKRSFYLTFDDGIRDHVTNVLPLLQSYSLEASFFIPGCLFSYDRCLPFLEKQRFLQYGCDDYRDFLLRFCYCVTSRFPYYRIDQIEPSQKNLSKMGNYLSEYSFFSLEERYYRFLRDKVLNEREFSNVIEVLFNERFGSEEKLRHTYYLSAEDVRTLRLAGMIIGGHTHTHEHLPRMADQRADIMRGLEVLEGISDVRPTTFSYPYGSYDATTLQIMAELGMAYAFTTQNCISPLDPGRPYEIPRIDAKELLLSCLFRV